MSFTNRVPFPSSLQSEELPPEQIAGEWSLKCIKLPWKVKIFLIQTECDEGEYSPDNVSELIAVQ